jgi:hypothetical protein
MGFPGPPNASRVLSVNKQLGVQRLHRLAAANGAEWSPSGAVRALSGRCRRGSVPWLRVGSAVLMPPLIWPAQLFVGQTVHCSPGEKTLYVARDAAEAPGEEELGRWNGGDGKASPAASRPPLRTAAAYEPKQKDSERVVAGVVVASIC